MKKGLLLLVSILFSLALHAQVVVYTEDFDPPTLNDSVSSTATGGVPHWALSSKLSVSAPHSDTCKVIAQGTSYLTTDFFTTTGNTYVLLEFDQICKISFFDNAEIEVTGDSGQTWHKLLAAHYLGTASFSGLGSRFAESSYGSLWAPGQPAPPASNWWKSELFDISAFCGDTTGCAVRFKLSDGGNIGAENRYGWLIDNIKVTAALSELTPPNIISFTPVLNGNIFNTGPFNFTAQITDASGIYQAFIPYTLNGVPDTVWLVNTSGNNWTGSIPAVSHLDQICYKLVAIDNSLSRNTAYSPQLGGPHCFTASTQEAALLSITSPNTACGLGLEEVKIQIKNTGLETIAGNLWAQYWIAGTTDTVTEYITDTILLNQILHYTFDSLIDVSAPTGNITYELKARIVLLGDPVPTNNNQTKFFTSGFVPPDPPILYDTVNYATTASLTTNIPNTNVKWYADSNGTQLLFTGFTYVTPILFEDTVYYRNATSVGTLPCASAIRPYYVEVGDKPPFDAALIEMHSPVSAINMLPQEKVEVRIVNFGGDTISNFPLNYKINSNPAITETYMDTLLPGDTADYLFNALADLSTPGNYQFTVWVALPGDTTYLNDTISRLVVHSVPNYCPSYAVNAATGSDIGNVTFSNLNNGSALPSTNNTTAIKGYTDWTSNAPAVQLAITQSYNFQVRRIVSGSAASSIAGVKLFIDYDRSGTFDPPTETAFQGTIPYYNYQTGATITIPSWVNPGVAHMRVVLQETNNLNNIQPCGTYGIGETEDYTVVLYPQIPFDGGVSAIITPSSLVPEASLQTVTVAIKNYGLDTLTSFDVSYEHNNNPPVTEPWTGTLLPGGITLFAFQTQLTVAGGPNDVCAYTSVVGDNNFGNDGTCKSFYGDPLQNAQAVALPEPDAEGCFVANEPVTIVIKNVGLDTISGGLQASYYVKQIPNSLVTEPVTATILPNAAISYTFNQLVDLTAYTQDTVWDIVAYTTLVGDFENHNDTAFTDVESLYSPPDPVVSNVTIQYATTATLTASSPDSIYWYEKETSTTELGTGPSYTTPILYGQEIYWVEAQTAGGASSITIGNGTSTQSYIPVYGYFGYGWSGSIFTAAELNTKGDIDTLAFYIGNTPSNYNMPNQRIYLSHTTSSNFANANYIPNTSMTKVYDGPINWNGSGWFKIPLTTSFNYNGTDNILVWYENHFGTWSSGYPQFRYTTTSGNKAVYDYQDGSFPTTSGTTTTSRPNMQFLGSGGGCPSNRVPDTVFVQNIPPYDGALLAITEPETGVNLTATEPVTVKIRNYGTQSISNFGVSYQINGGIIRTDTVPVTLQQNDTLDYTFIQPVNLEFYGTYQFKAWISVLNDATGTNDTLYKTVKCLLPPYCLSYATNAGTYTDIGNVTISNLNNGNPNPSTSNPSAQNAYTDFTHLTPVMLSPTVGYPISISRISSSTLYSSNVGVKVYIDYNRNGIFNLPQELAYSGVFSGTNPTVTGTLTVPVTATPGMTLMRVVMDRYGAAPACATYTYGETEDYLALIIPMIPNDAGVTDVLSPGDLSTAGVVTPVTVKIQNFGTNTLGSVDIAYEVNNGPPTVYTYLNPLAPQATAIVNLPALTLGNGNHRICAYTIVPGDSNTFNDTRCIDCYAEFVADLPYSNNFDKPAAEFWPDSLPNQWERGIPSGTVLNTAKSNPNVWGTTLDGPYIHNGANFLYTPRFNHLITGIDSLKFWQRFHTNTGDGAAIQYKSILGWKLLGSPNDPNGVNWYNSPQNLWTGNGGQSGWMQSAYNLKNIYDMAEPTQFRFIFFTTALNTNNFEGWIMDNLEITIPIIPQDAGVVEILGPPSPTVIGTDIDVEIRIQNFGSDTLYSIPVRYKVNGATVNTGLWTGALAPDSTTTYTFGPLPSPLFAYTLCAFTDVSGDINTYNNTTCDTYDVLPPNYDLAVTEIISPLNPTIHGDSATVTVQVENRGLNSFQSFDIQYAVAGNIIATETWTDSLNPFVPGDTLYYTFTQKYKHDYIGFYYLCSKTLVSGDGYPWNDEKCTILEELYTEVTETDLEGFNMGQNIPNPALDMTVIPFNLPSYGTYRFVLLNYLGQPVFTQERTVNAGLHQIELDADAFTPGAYFYSLEFEGRRLVRKMIVQ